MVFLLKDFIESKHITQDNKNFIHNILFRNKCLADKEIPW